MYDEHTDFSYWDETGYSEGRNDAGPDKDGNYPGDPFPARPSEVKAKPRRETIATATATSSSDPATSGESELRPRPHRRVLAIPPGGRRAPPIPFGTGTNSRPTSPPRRSEAFPPVAERLRPPLEVQGDPRARVVRQPRPLAITWRLLGHVSGYNGSRRGAGAPKPPFLTCDP
jgi:hypothetical protein